MILPSGVGDKRWRNPEASPIKVCSKAVKKIARELLESLKREKLVLDWKKPQTTRATVRLTVETVLDSLPGTYTPELYQQKCDLVYQHIFDSYQGSERPSAAPGHVPSANPKYHVL
jgi:hypothetical protein